MSWIQFESGREKNAARNGLRESRGKILEKVEAEYHKKQLRTEQARLRGDDEWMLPSVESKINGCKKSSRKRKKEKKEKKEKKSKKKKKLRPKSTSSSGSSGEGEEDDAEEWIEKLKSEKEKVINSNSRIATREEWMNLPGLFPCVSRNEQRRLKTKEKEQEKERGSIDQLGKNERELNPYWKNGGTGLPETQAAGGSNSAGLMDPKWLIKSLRRAQEHAAEEGRSLEEVVSERWGSLERLETMIADARNKSSNSSELRRKYDQDGGGRSVRQTNNNRHNQRRGDRSRSKARQDWRERFQFSDEEKRGSESRSKELHRPEGRDRKLPGRRDENDQIRRRSQGREENFYQNESDFSRQCKLGFKKPDPDSDYSDFAGTSKCSTYSSSKSWKKPEALKREAEKIFAKSESKRTSESEDNADDYWKPTNETEEEKFIMTEAEMNQLGAKIIKCEMMGDNVLASELKAKLETAREPRENAPAKPTADRKEKETVILTKTDARGMTRPVEPRSEYEEPKGGRNRKKKVNTHEGGQRVRYFADDDKYSIKEMFQLEKGRSTNDDDAMFTKIASKNMDIDEIFEDKVRFREADAKQNERDRLQAIKQHEKMSKSLDNCKWCIDSKQMLKHMIVAMGSKVYMSLPSHGSLTTGQCILAPIHHVMCQTQIDEDIWEELQSFRKVLTRMFLDQEKDVIFFETSMGHHKFPHMQLECVPMPKEIGDLAPIYFKKALLECETEWSTNKKVIDLSTKNVRRSIPKGLPYFAVDFGMQGGFAHVIEDEEMFPKNFAQEIIGGMLDLDRNSWWKPKRENFDQQRTKVMEFAKMWKKYDFTMNDDTD